MVAGSDVMGRRVTLGNYKADTATLRVLWVIEGPFQLHAGFFQKVVRIPIDG